jgi:hypothetical protein
MSNQDDTPTRKDEDSPQEGQDNGKPEEAPRPKGA